MARFEKWRQDYIKLLDRLEPEFNKYNKTLINERKNALNIPYREALEKSIFHFTVQNDKIKLELEALQKKAKIERDNPAFIKKLEQCRNEVEKRNLNFQEYLEKRKTDETAIPLESIETILKTMSLINQLNDELLPFGITIEQILQAKGKNLIDATYNEILSISDIIQNHLKKFELTGDFDVNEIDFKEERKIG